MQSGLSPKKVNSNAPLTVVLFDFDPVSLIRSLDAYNFVSSWNSRWISLPTKQ